MDDPADCRGNQDLAVQFQKLVIANGVGAGESDHGPGLIGVRDQGVDIESGVVVNSAVSVGDRDHLAPKLTGDPRGP